MRFLALLGLVVVVVAAACGGSRRSILYRGVASRPGPRFTVSDANARRDAGSMRARWLTDVGRRGHEDATRFSNLPVQRFLSRLREAAARYHFTVERVELLRPRQLAPLVIVQTRNYLGLARAIRPIESALDPHRGGNDLTGWAFEGIFLEAQDERGVPFLAVENALRGPHAYGGQWARSEELFPFPHR
jgi:hypothetical protein